MLKLRSTGRGRRYTRLRGLVESAQSLAYAGGWPARLLGQIPPASRVRVLRHSFSLLPHRPGRRALRLAFISDLHLGPLTPMKLIDDAFARLQESEPDVLVMGGDYVSLEVTKSMAAQLAASVGAFRAPLKLAVLGNHDLWTHHELIERALADGGARVMLNDSIRLPAPYDDVAIVGLDDPWTGMVDPDKAFAGVDAPLKLVLTHAPEAIPLVEGRGVGLLMCGHTHGGQVAAPWGPLMVEGHFGRRWPHGLHDINGMQLFVSRGVGYSDLPVRSFAPSDVAIIDILSPAAGEA
jgi:predicted MPP superfamily phosphohydrolase